MKDIQIENYFKKNDIIKMLLIAALLWGCALSSVPAKAAGADNENYVSSVKLGDSNQAIERAKHLHLMPEEKVIIKTKKLAEPEESWEISYTSGELDDVREPKLKGIIVLSAVTGELLLFSKTVKLSSGSCGYPCHSEPIADFEEAVETASSFMKDLYLPLDANWKLNEYPESEYIKSRSYPSHLISFDRIYEGIRYPSDGITVYVSGWTGEVYKYSIKWTGVKFEKPKDMISYAEAGRIFFDAIEPAVLWSENPRNPEISKLVYYSRSAYMLDAKGKFAEGNDPEPTVYPSNAKPKYPIQYAKHRILSLYELELHYMDTKAGKAEPFYRLRIKPGVPLYYYEPHPYIDADNGEWINFFHEPLPEFIPPAGDWLIDYVAPAGKVNYKAAVVWNNELAKLENEPIINNGFTLVPFRELLEKLDAKISWDPVKRKVTASKNGTKIELTIDSDTAYINGKATSLGTPARITKGRTYIPARIVLETFGAKVGWNAASRLVLVQTDDSLPKLTSLEIDRLRLHAQINWEENYWKP